MGLALEHMHAHNEVAATARGSLAVNEAVLLGHRQQQELRVDVVDYGATVAGRGIARGVGLLTQPVALQCVERVGHELTGATMEVSHLRRELANCQDVGRGEGAVAVDVAVDTRAARVTARALGAPRSHGTARLAGPMGRRGQNNGCAEAAATTREVDVGCAGDGFDAGDAMLHARRIDGDELDNVTGDERHAAANNVERYRAQIDHA